MPDESAGVKVLWLVFGPTTKCGKEVDNFQSNPSDSAQTPERARGFSKGGFGSRARKKINLVRRTHETIMRSTCRGSRRALLGARGASHKNTAYPQLAGIRPRRPLKRLAAPLRRFARHADERS